MTVGSYVSWGIAVLVRSSRRLVTLGFALQKSEGLVEHTDEPTGMQESFINREVHLSPSRESKRES